MSPKWGEEDPSPFLVFRVRAYQLLEVVSSVLSWHQFVGPLLALQQALPLGRARSTRKLPVNNQHEGLQLLGSTLWTTGYSSGLLGLGSWSGCETLNYRAQAQADLYGSRMMDLRIW